MGKYTPTRSQQNRLLRHLLWVNQNGKCKICKNDKAENEGIIEHHNGNNADYIPENIGFVCYSCNQRKRPDYCQQGSVSSGESVCVNPKAEITDSERFRAKSRIEKASPEIQINQDSEPIVRRYLWEHIGREGGLLVEDAVEESAETADCSSVTSRRHIKKACSLAGPFEIYETQLMDGGILTAPKRAIRLREGHSPNLASRLGRLDNAIMQERIERAKEEVRKKEQELIAKAKQLDETEAEQKELMKRYSEIGNERTTLREILKRELGWNEEQIQKHLASSDAEVPKRSEQ